MRNSIRSIAWTGAVAGVLAMGQAGAAVKLSNAFDGNVFRGSEAGRGISIDVVPRPDGSNIFFGALFTFDSSGDPTFLTIQGEFLEHQFSRDDLGVFQTTGGAFGFPFPATTTEQVGTASVTINSCNSIDISLDMESGSGFEDVTLENLRQVNGATDQCVYRSEFEGCPSFAFEVPGVERACALNGVYRNQDITLTNETTWILDGLVRIGDDNDNYSTVTIEPGTVLAGGGGSADYLYISPGSKIFANGTPNNPIVFTSDQDGFQPGSSPQPGDVGGLVLSGNAPVNACPEAPFNCFSEFDSTQRFGGDDPHDSSGELTYMQVRYAGIVFQEDSEVNSFTFQGVGDGTTVHHLQAYRGQDDGFEWFGGTVNQKHLVVTEGGDDCLDHDLGFSGKVQYALCYHGEGFGEDFGIEGAGNPDNFSAEPLATPIYANLTMVGNGNGDSAFLFKDGSAGQIWNSVATGFPTSCLEFADAPATYDNAGTPGDPVNTAFMGVVLACDTQFLDDEGAPYTVQSFFNSNQFMNNRTVSNLRLNGAQPQSNSPAIGNGVNIADDFFDSTSYSGAFDGVIDWTSPWTHRPMGGE